MKYYTQWRTAFTAAMILALAAGIWLLITGHTLGGIIVLITGTAAAGLFFGFWQAVREQGIKVELDISRVLGKDAKDALQFGSIGMLTYNDEFVCTWESEFFTERDIDLVNRKLTSWIENIRDLVDEEVDTITGVADGHIYEITRKKDAPLLYVKDVTELVHLKAAVQNEETVAGLMQLDNYIEYQSYENEDILAAINTQLRGPLVTWAKDNGMFLRRIRADRILVICDRRILETVRKNNLTILQEVKDKARGMDVSITLSMAFAYGTHDYVELDNMLNELIELAQSRGGDQCAIQEAGHEVIYIGGNSESSSQRSKVRVRIMAGALQDAIREADAVYIAGHVNTDYDCMGAALAVSNWCRALGKQAYIVLKDIPRDRQLQETMDKYSRSIGERHTFITPEDAKNRMNFSQDLLVMVDHSIPEISSAQSFVDEARKIAVIDHHRRNAQFVDNPMITYVESQSSSTVELVTELLQNIPRHVPIFEAEATIMYLGLLVDTNRFKMHTSARTFETAAVLRSWGVNGQEAEEALLEDFDIYQEKAGLISKAEIVDDRFLMAASPDPLDRTLISQISDSMLKIKGAQASFTLAPDPAAPDSVRISARSNGEVNVQRIMEKMGGGGHFAAAATLLENTRVDQAKELLKKTIEEDSKNESDPA